MKNYVTEIIGTFFLVLVIGLTVLGGTQFAPLAIGSTLMVMVFMGGHISGAHYNPAVTLGVALRGKMKAPEAGRYMISQLIGSVIAAFTARGLMGKTFAPAPGADHSLFQALVVEVLFTFALVLVVLNVATADATSGNSFYGLAIGFTVVVGAFAGGPISGGAFNPAVGLGPTLVDTLFGGGTSLGHVWLYIVGPFVGGILAAAVFRLQHS